LMIIQEGNGLYIGIISQIFVEMDRQRINYNLVSNN
jgi:hypothetical protein